MTKEVLWGNQPDTEFAELVVETTIWVMNLMNSLGTEVVRDYPVDGVVFGGTFANGVYCEGDDLDADIIYEEIPEETDLVGFVQSMLCQAFIELGINLHVRTNIDRSGRAVTFGQLALVSPSVERELGDIENMYTTQHPNSPYVARNEEVVEFWGLET